MFCLLCVSVCCSTAALSPGLIRLGGSPEDSVIYDADGTCVPMSGGRGPAQDYYCSQVAPYSYDCLTPQRWADLLEFADATGMKIVLGLNGEADDASISCGSIHASGGKGHSPSSIHCNEGKAPCSWPRTLRCKREHTSQSPPPRNPPRYRHPLQAALGACPT